MMPDPLGDVDSQILYAFAGGDPVNGRDASGESAVAVSVPVTAPGPTLLEGEEVTVGGGELLGVRAAPASGPMMLGVVLGEVTIAPFRIKAWWDERQANRAEEAFRETLSLNESRLRRKRHGASGGWDNAAVLGGGSKSPTPQVGVIATEEELSSPYWAMLAQTRRGTAQWQRLKNLHEKWLKSIATTCLRLTLPPTERGVRERFVLRRG